MDYEAAVRWLEGTIGKPKADYMTDDGDRSFFLERMQHLADLLNNPEKEMRYIHVLGSSGKGSTSTMLYEILRAAGEKAALYQSPHVCTPTERIQWNGQLISSQDFADATELVRAVVDEIEKRDAKWYPSYAEIFFAIALMAFQKAKVSMIVLEAGCGGRYDKTNIIPTPITTLFTPISLDHVGLLGETLEEIAEEKAGAIKNGTEVFAAQPDAPVVGEAIESAAAGVGVEVNYVHPNEEFDLSLSGPHQQVNANLAAAAARRLGIGEMNIRDGIVRAALPARVEQVQENPRVIIDGAHSEAKVAALVASLRALEPWDSLHLIVAVKETKTLVDIVPALADIADSVTATTFQLPGFGSHRPSDVAEAFREADPQLIVDEVESPMTALMTALEKAKKNDIVVVTGSLYIAGQLREHWYPKANIIKQRTPFPVS